MNSDEVIAARVDFQYSLDSDYISSVEFGARYSEREYSSDRSVYEFGSDSGFNSKEKPLNITEDMATVVDWKGDFSSFPSYLALDQSIKCLVSSRYPSTSTNVGRLGKWRN